MGTINMIKAIKKNDPLALQNALDFFKSSTKKEYDLNQAVQINGQRLLHIAIKHGSEIAFLYLLLEPQIDINISDNNGNTPAHYAVIYKQPKLLEFLKNSGADFSKRNKHGYTLERYILINPKKQENKSLKKELENIVMDTSNHPTSSCCFKKMGNLKSKIINFNKIPVTNNASFFHNLPREFEYQAEPLNLSKFDKPLNLSITSCFK